MSVDTTTLANTQEMLALLGYFKYTVQEEPTARPMQSTPKRSLEICEVAALGDYFRGHIEPTIEPIKPEINWEQRATLILPSATKLTNSARVKLSSAFRIMDTELVFDYIAKHSHLLSVLPTASLEIRRHFPSCNLTLELLCDPDDSSSQLMLYIMLKEDITDGRMPLKALRKNWWLQQPYEVRQNLCIDVAYEL